MKLISVSACGGRQWLELIAFLNLHQERVDVFCFQAVYADFGKASGLLTNFKAYFVPILKNSADTELPNSNLSLGSAIFVRQGYTVQDYQEVRVRNIQVLDITKQEKKYRIINVHGLRGEGAQDDNVERLDQAKHIINLVETSSNPVVVTGDFEVSPETRSIKLLVDSGLVSLTDEYRIRSTWSELSAQAERLTDYMFISPKIKVKGFSVPNVAISDHLPLIFEAK